MPNDLKKKENSTKPIKEEINLSEKTEKSDEKNNKTEE